MPWTIVVAAGAVRSLRRIRAHERGRIEATLEQMVEAPFDGDIKRLRNDRRGGFRRRVGPWRIFFDPFPTEGLLVIQAVERRTSTTYR
jgi:mRNA-degrading endonuclease RelE of RelBE toxin-antitoxin system